MSRATQPLDVMEDAGRYVVDVPVTELEPGTLAVTLRGRNLEVAGRRQRIVGFRRVLRLPFDSDTDAIDVVCSGKGVRIVLPKVSRKH